MNRPPANNPLKRPYFGFMAVLGAVVVAAGISADSLLVLILGLMTAFGAAASLVATRVEGILGG